MNILNQNDSFRSLKNINFNGIESVLIKQCQELEQDIAEIYIDQRFTFDIINSFNKRQINPSNINDIIELCNYLQIEETENFIVNNCEPSDNYKIEDKYLEDLKFPIFITNFDKNCNITNEISEHKSLNWLKYAHENGSPWNKRTCKNAAEGGSLECLKYLHENGCPWDENTDS